jgi:hypothetical protein
MGHPTAAVPENVSGDALKQDSYRSLGPGPSDGTIAPLPGQLSDVSIAQRNVQRAARGALDCEEIRTETDSCLADRQRTAAHIYDHCLERLAA